MPCLIYLLQRLSYCPWLNIHLPPFLYHRALLILCARYTRRKTWDSPRIISRALSHPPWTPGFLFDICDGRGNYFLLFLSPLLSRRGLLLCLSETIFRLQRYSGVLLSIRPI